MQYNDVIDALMEIAQAAYVAAYSGDVPQSQDQRVKPEWAVIPLDLYHNLKDSLAALEALPQANTGAAVNGPARAVEFIKEHRNTANSLYEENERLRAADRSLPVIQLHLVEAKLARAERALQQAGYEDHGGQEWVPPVNTAYPFLMQARDALLAAKNVESRDYPAADRAFAVVRDKVLVALHNLNAYRDSLTPPLQPASGGVAGPVTVTIVDDKRDVARSMASQAGEANVMLHIKPKPSVTENEDDMGPLGRAMRIRELECANSDLKAEAKELRELLRRAKDLLDKKDVFRDAMQRALFESLSDDIDTALREE